MLYDDKSKKMELPHHLIMEGRSRMSVSGVEDVDSFDENEIVMFTSKGELIVKGLELHVEKLSLDIGELEITGSINSCEYAEERKKQEGFFARLFG